ncbi:hypothetical protein BECAL_03047 [Bellilinea caldifistulae]|uniref:hypothetical protein n=1 Tax=Bellilinea caldifistulae TaxID=360411 RepID=UPI0011AEBEF5|nr:hypothetical protein [Bellilinea caldifistulae]GAP11853.1 hypothetical protein BECAL_03047 [Bellilinea caldifistulae]
MRKHLPTGFLVIGWRISRLLGATPGQPLSTGLQSPWQDFNKRAVHRLTGVHWDKSLSFSIPAGEGCSLPSAWGTKGGEPNVNQLLQAIPLLVIFAVLLIAYDLAQKYFILRMLKQAKDKDEREVIITLLTRRR